MATPTNGQVSNEYQPGIEVAPQQSGIEVAPQQPGIEVAPQQPGIEVAPQQSIGEKEFAGHTADHVLEVTHGNEAVGQPKRKKKVLIIAAVCAGVVIIVLVGVLAGVLTRHHPDEGAPTPFPTPPTSSSPPNMTGTSITAARYLFPTPISWGYPQLDVIALTTNTSSAVYRKYRPSNATSSQDWYPRGSDFEPIGGGVNIGSSVAVRSRTQGGNTTDVYATGERGGVYRKWHSNDQVWNGLNRNSGPGDWELVTNGAAISAPAIVSYNELMDDVFVLAKGAHNNTIHTIRWADDLWGSYKDLGGGDMQFTPAAVSWDGMRVDVFGVSSANNHLFHTYAGDGTTWATFNGGASVFEDLAGFCTSSPVVVSRAKGILDVFARGGDGGLWQLSYNRSWSPWTLISGKTTIQGQPDALSWDAKRIDIFAWGSDNSLLTKSFNAQTGQWTPSDGFDQIGTGLSGPPKSVSDAVGSMHVFAYGRSSDVVWKQWNISEGGEWPAGDFAVLGAPIF